MKRYKLHGIAVKSSSAGPLVVIINFCFFFCFNDIPLAIPFAKRKSPVGHDVPIIYEYIIIMLLQGR